MVVHLAVGFGVVGLVDEGNASEQENGTNHGRKGYEERTRLSCSRPVGCPVGDRSFLCDVCGFFPRSVRSKGSDVNPDPPGDPKARLYVRECDERKIGAYLPHQR